MSETGVRNGTGPQGLIIGTAGWSYDSWVGAFYPAGTNARGYLAEYSRVFRAVEIDSTFYAMPRADYVRRWAQVTPEGFVFCPKMVQTVTHERELVGCQAETQAFLDRMSMLGDKLGPVVLQFHYQFKPDRMGVLATYLESLPENRRFAVEVRNRGWLTDGFYQVLNEHRTALVLGDLHYMPRLDVVTTDFVYVRWLAESGRAQRLLQGGQEPRPRAGMVGGKGAGMVGARAHRLCLCQQQVHGARPSHGEALHGEAQRANDARRVSSFSGELRALRRAALGIRAFLRWREDVPECGSGE